MLEPLVQAADELRACEEQTEQARARLAALLRELHEAGIPVTRLAEIVDLSRSQVRTLIEHH